jgi:hypothetical protein
MGEVQTVTGLDIIRWSSRGTDAPAIPVEFALFATAIPLRGLALHRSDFKPGFPVSLVAH